MEGDLEMKLLLIGPPGSGKGTQGKELIKHYGIPAISTGDLIRARMNADVAFAEKFADVSKGNFIPDIEITKMVQERVKQDDCKNGYILDGFPRNLAQGEINFTIAVDESYPLLTSLYKQGEGISIKLNEIANCQYSTEKFTYGTGTPMGENTVLHSATGSEEYHIICQDIYGNIMPEVVVYT